MTCRQIRHLLSVRREWTAQEQSVVEVHLDGCPACQAAAREYELTNAPIVDIIDPDVIVVRVMFFAGPT